MGERIPWYEGNKVLDACTEDDFLQGDVYLQTSFNAARPYAAGANLITFVAQAFPPAPQPYYIIGEARNYSWLRNSVCRRAVRVQFERPQV